MSASHDFVDRSAEKQPVVSLNVAGLAKVLIIL